MKKEMSDEEVTEFTAEVAQDLERFIRVYIDPDMAALAQKRELDHEWFMRQAILDEYTDLNISRQRKKQIRNVRDGKCSICGKPVSKHTVNFCEFHRQQFNLRQQQRKQKETQ